MADRKMTRRRFLKASMMAGTAAALAGCAGFPTIVPRSVLGGPRFVPPSEKLNLAIIGAGGQGRNDIQRGFHTENIIAFADVDWQQAKRTFDEYPDVPRYRDYREMLDDLDDQIDAVTISTPDHTHAVAAMDAMRRNKHVFVQKPLAHSIYECRLLADEARKRGLVSIMGIQGHAGEGIRLINEWIAQGAIGEPREVHYWTNRPIWPQGIRRPEDTPPIPETLSWDLWLGPAPERPYHPAYLPFRWRGWWDYGTGALGDIGCHIMDAAYWALNLGEAEKIRVHTVSSPVNDETFPKWSIIFYEVSFPGNRPDIKIVWHDGGKTAPRPENLEQDRELNREGAQVIYGSEGTILSQGLYGGSPRLIPETAMQRFIRENEPKKTIPRIEGGHYEEWIRACKGGDMPGANFDYAAGLSEFVLIGNLSLRLGQEIEYDFKNAKITNIPNSEELVRPPMREGWRL